MTTALPADAGAAGGAPGTEAGTGAVPGAALLEVRDIRKAFPGVVALDGVSFDVLAGEVHALIGENGAGKSTLLNIMSGILRPDSGAILVAGRQMEMAGPETARRNRIAFVHQELALCPNLTVAENIFLGIEPRGRWGKVDYARMNADAAALLALIHVSLDPRRTVDTLSLSEQQIVEICRALAADPTVIVFDEPTASLGEERVADLLAILRRLRDRGLGIVYVSHRLNEVLAIADRITALRDGCVIGTRPAAAAVEADLIRMMVGRDIADQFPRHEGPAGGPAGEPALELRGLGADGRFADISFTLRRGEVLGLAGLMGCQREAVIRALFGLQRTDRGEVLVHGRPTVLDSPRRAIAAGLAYMPADRKREGLVLSMGVNDNAVFTVLRRLSRSGLFDFPARNRIARDMIDRLRIKVAGPSVRTVNLSGGNQQKVVIAKWLARDQDILIFEEPTRGIDIAAKAQIWSLIAEFVAQGKAILVVSSELPELMGISDRILVMNKGRITGRFDRAGSDAPPFDAEEIARCAAVGEAA